MTDEHEDDQLRLLLWASGVVVSVVVFYVGAFAPGPVGTGMRVTGIVGTVACARRAGRWFGSWWWTVVVAAVPYAPFILSFPIVRQYDASTAWLAAVVEVTTHLLGLATLLAAFSFLFVGYFFPIALFLDARHVRRSDASWEPNPLLYGVLGITSYGTGLINVLPEASAASRNLLTVGTFLVAVGYLAQRYRYTNLGG